MACISGLLVLPARLAAIKADANSNTMFHEALLSGGGAGCAISAGEEVANDRCDLRATTLERKMAGIEQMDFGLRVVALEGFRASRQKERIVLAPHRKKRRSALYGNSPGISGRERRCSDSRRTNRAGYRHCRAGRGAQRQSPGVGRKPFTVRYTMRVLSIGGLWR